MAKFLWTEKSMIPSKLRRYSLHVVMDLCSNCRKILQFITRIETEEIETYERLFGEVERA